MLRRFHDSVTGAVPVRTPQVRWLGIAQSSGLAAVIAVAVAVAVELVRAPSLSQSRFLHPTERQVAELAEDAFATSFLSVTVRSDRDMGLV
jgi:hypothetical protein